MNGPLHGFKILEIASIGPGPFCAMMFADQGAEVIRIDRKSEVGRGSKYNVLNRGRRSVAVDLKTPEGVELVLRMVEQCDALIEGFRPGVMERLGLGPDVCLERNPKLVYGRMTGWGQTGSLAHAAGHDINFISLSGALHAIGRPDTGPVPPLNLVGDFGGGGMMLAYGVVCALLESQRSGQGQVVDAAMTDGSALLMAAIFGLMESSAWTAERGVNLLDSGAHFYDVYRCADDEYISVGSIEPQFYKLLLAAAGLTGDDRFENHQMDRGAWPELSERLAEIFAARTRADWCEVMEGTDICFAPVLDFKAAQAHQHNRDRQTFINVSGVNQPAPAPRFSRTPGQVSGPPPMAGQHTATVLAQWGWSQEEIDDLCSCGAI